MTIFDPAPFNFGTDNVRVDGIVVSGGTSLSGLDDAYRSDGGGFWRADFADGDFGGRDDDEAEVTLAWRAVNAAMAGGAAAVDVMLWDLLHQPVRFGLPNVGAVASITGIVNGQAGGLRATSLDITITSEKPLRPGHRFTVDNAAWGPRLHEIITVAGNRITFQPPLREAVTVGQSLDFVNPRCRMRRTSAATNEIAAGVYVTGASISFVEDMRPPA